MKRGEITSIFIKHLIYQSNNTIIIEHYNFISRCSAGGSIEHDRCRWQIKGVRNGAKQGVMRSGNEQNDYVLTVSHVVARLESIEHIIAKNKNGYRDVAQVVARHVRDVDAASSNLVISTNKNPDYFL